MGDESGRGDASEVGPLRLLTPLAMLFEGRIQRGLSVLCEAGPGRVLKIAESAGLREEHPEAESVDLSERVLLPGAVNVHSHAFQVLLRGRADNAPTFRRWVDEHMYELVLSMSEDELEAGMRLAFTEMVLSGITTVGEFYYVHNDRETFARRGTDLDELAIRVAREVGLRIALVRTLYDGQGHPGRARFRETVPEAIGHTEALHARYRDHDFVSVVPAPHSLHAASAEMIQAGHELARRLGTPLHIHLAEQQHDLAFSQERYGTTPLRALEKLGVVDERLVCVHGVWLDEEEWGTLGAARGGLAYNPSANMFLGDGITNLFAAASAGVRIALGCDGPGGNNRIDIFTEMRLSEMLQRAKLCRMGVLTEALPDEVCPPFTFGTRNGALNLGLDAGELREGALADFIAIDPFEVSLLPNQDLDTEVLLNNLVYAGSIRAALRDVFVGGRDVVRDGQPTLVDLSEVRRGVAAFRS